MKIRRKPFHQSPERDLGEKKEAERLMATSTLSSRGQAVIPAEIRRAADAQEGDQLVWTWDDGKIVVHVQRRPKLSSLIGVLQPKRGYRDPADVRQGVYADMAKREHGQEES